jgi:nitrate/TMAO reductase-like tetraheme cytochrome c subunit
MWDPLKFMTGTVKRPVWFVLTQHWLSLVGLALLVTALISWLFVLPLQIRGHVDNPYIGILAFLILPFIFFAGLALVPVGVFLSKRRIKQGLAESEFDRNTGLRRLAWFFGATTFFNVLIGTQITYRAVEHMETPQFCGGTCHTMAPEFAAYQNSPHSRVECVDCHVAPGAGGWMASKAAGTRQLIETVLHRAPKPIPSAIESNRLVPARETCENCHWPQKFGGVTLRVINKYGSDEANSRTQTVLMMLVGGQNITGIHGSHFGPGIQIRFAAADGKRQTIPWVEYRNTTTGVTEVFSAAEAGKESVETLPKHEMQCVDCHNRPTHAFDSPESGMDKAMARGEIPVTLPFIKKKGVELLQATYSSSAEAAQKIPNATVNFYREAYPELYQRRSRDIEEAGQSVLAIYNRNVFPDLKVNWGTYPNNLGHVDSPGCFRCHDGSHTSASGKTINQDCTVCHQPLAMDEAKPEILTTLGVAERISNIEKQ